MAGDPQFWVLLCQYHLFLLGMPLSIAGSLFLAVLLNQRLRGIVIYRTLFYLPSFTSGVALMILWKALYNPDFGPINAAIHWCGRPRSICRSRPRSGFSPRKIWWGWMWSRCASTRAHFGIGARDAIILMGIWTAIGGGNMLLYLAALTNIPQELIEAAQIDGAGSWAVFPQCPSGPQLAPRHHLSYRVVMSLSGDWQGGFEQARVMSAGRVPPARPPPSLIISIPKRSRSSRSAMPPPSPGRSFLMSL